MSVVELRDELSRFPVPWRPAPGDMLIGTVVDVGERTGFAGDRYPTVTVRTEEGDDVIFHAFHTVAKDELARQRPRAGERIGIAYHGRDPEKGYERYRLKVVRDQDLGEPDWAAIRHDADQEHAVAREQDAPSADDEIPF